MVLSVPINLDVAKEYYLATTQAMTRKMIQAIYMKAKLYLLMRLSNTPALHSDTPPGVVMCRSVATEEAQEPLNKVIDGCLYFLLFHL